MIIEALKEIQKREKMEDLQMAEKLGVHKNSWSRIKNGRAGHGKEFIVAAVRAFPEIAEAVLEELWGPDYLDIVFPIFRRIIESMKAVEAKPETGGRQ